MKRRKRGCLGGLSPELLGRMAQVLKLLAHPQRLGILDLLDRQGASPVHAVMEGLGLAQCVASQHLNQMRRLDLVRAERRGKEVWYGIGDRRSLKILNCMRGKGEGS